MKMTPMRIMNLLVGAVKGADMIFRAPFQHLLKTELDRIHATYGGVYAIDRTHYINTHECIPIFASPTEVLELTKTTSILILYPERNTLIERLYEENKGDTSEAQRPLFMFSLELYLMFLRSVLILEYGGIPMK